MDINQNVQGGYQQPQMVYQQVPPQMPPQQMAQPQQAQPQKSNAEMIADAQEVLKEVFNMGVNTNQQQEQQAKEEGFFNSTLGKVSLVTGGGLLGAGAVKFFGSSKVNSSEVEQAVKAVKDINSIGVGNVIKALFK